MKTNKANQSYFYSRLILGYLKHAGSYKGLMIRFVLADSAAPEQAKLFRLWTVAYDELTTRDFNTVTRSGLAPYVHYKSVTNVVPLWPPWSNKSVTVVTARHLSPIPYLTSAETP